MFETLEPIVHDIERRLAEAVRDRRSPMHTPIVGTADADVRVMVLRDFDQAAGTLRFHTDARAPKCRVIERSPAVGVLFYDREEKVQVRVRGSGRVERTGAFVDDIWRQATNFARRCYLGAAPGEAAPHPTSGLPPRFEGVEPTDEDLLPARANFAALLVAIEAVEWLYLSNAGHRRARFDWTRPGRPSQWLTP
jgi:general stress protein 26